MHIIQNLVVIIAAYLVVLLPILVYLGWALLLSRKYSLGYGIPDLCASMMRGSYLIPTLKAIRDLKKANKNTSLLGMEIASLALPEKRFRHQDLVTWQLGNNPIPEEKEAIDAIVRRSQVTVSACLAMLGMSWIFQVGGVILLDYLDTPYTVAATALAVSVVFVAVLLVFTRALMASTATRVTEEIKKWYEKQAS